VREVHLRRGTLTTRIAHVETRTYTVHNADQKAKTLVIEHPARTEYALVSPQQNEKTVSAYRFVVRLAPGATEKLAVTEERLDEAAVAIANLTPDVLLTYVQNKALSETAVKQLEQILERKRQLAGIDAEMRRAETRINAVSRDQERCPGKHSQLESGQRSAAAGAGLRAAARQSGARAGYTARPLLRVA